MKTAKTLGTIVLLFAMGTTQANAQQNSRDMEMKTYLIEREIPDAGKLTQEQLKGISQKSCSVLKEMDTGIEWLHSYVTDNKVYCVYKAENKALIREHAEKGGFPVNSISELSSKIGPDTARR
ncbi:DUF4242 domain-containing protein [Ulvibacterium sp.]|uniref:DUF4242 domain-containing protein n=1 Tax=Ulvibacterium sp. TaxID=2665914 RepID=UPI003BAC1E0C